MPPFEKIRNLIKKYFITRRNIIMSGMLHAATGLVFLAMYFALLHFLPSTTPSSEIEGCIQLLAQILALVVGVLMLGTTVSLSSYNDAVSLNTIQTDLSKTSEKFFTHFFDKGQKRYKIQHFLFLSAIIRRPKIDAFQFFNPTNSSEDSWFIYRPYWDGVWYQVMNSPFATESKTREQFYQTQTVHEVVVNAFTVLKSIYEFRKSGGALVSVHCGTNGSRSFIRRFEAYISLNGTELPSELDIISCIEVVTLAMASTHYFREELRQHSENLNWNPYTLTVAQLKFSSYLLSVLQLVQKIQLLRLANAAVHSSTSLGEIDEGIQKMLSLELMFEVRKELADLETRIITAHGAANYFHSIKKMSIPGIGISLIVLIGLLSGWPFLKFATDISIQHQGFATLYAAGIAALIESSWFLARLLWKRRALTT